jgi:hypothetical protein
MEKFNALFVRQQLGVKPLIMGSVPIHGRFLFVKIDNYILRYTNQDVLSYKHWGP